MTERERVINGAVRAFDEHKADVLRPLRLAFVDQVLRNEGLGLMDRDEIGEVNAAAEAGQVPYVDCDGGACRRCGD